MSKISSPSVKQESARCVREERIVEKKRINTCILLLVDHGASGMLNLSCKFSIYYNLETMGIAVRRIVVMLKSNEIFASHKHTEIRHSIYSQKGFLLICDNSRSTFASNRCLMPTPDVFLKPIMGTEA